MIKQTFILFLCFWSVVVTAQQTLQYSLQFLNPSDYNPAYVGISTQIEATGLLRMQWVHLDGSPTSQNFNISAPVPYLSGGLGVKLVTEQIGLFRNTQLGLSYAYQLLSQSPRQITIGVRGGLNTVSLNSNQILTPDGEYLSGVNHNDNRLFNGKTSATSFFLDAGVYFRSTSLDIGASVSNINQAEISLNDNNIKNFSYVHHLALFMAYRRSIGQNLELSPSVWFKTSTIQSQLDVAIQLEYNQQFLGGMLVRGYNTNTLDALGIFGGLKFFKNWQMVYGYDIPFSSLKSVQRGSHEIMLKYNLDKTLGKSKMPRVIHTPRFL